jgi:hypothetical protein
MCLAGGGDPGAETSLSEIQGAGIGGHDCADGVSRPIIPAEGKVLPSSFLCRLAGLCVIGRNYCGGAAIVGLRNFDGKPSENAERPVNLLKLARQPRDVNHLQAIVGADSTHDSMNVIFYGLFGEI